VAGFLPSKHSRLLTCYSALLYLLGVYRRQNSVGPTDAVAMIDRTPTERLEWLMDEPGLAAAHRTIANQYLAAAHTFGDLMFEALMQIGGGGRFHRLLIA
jgi:hypothetical protein